MKNPLRNAVSRVQRELPDTDQDRYDIAYERGHAQARSKLVVAGMAIGSAAGAGLMWLMDPARGAARRAQLGTRLEGLRGAIGERTSGRGSAMRSRVQSFTVDRGSRAAGAGVDNRATYDHQDYGDGYRAGFGATEADPTAPGNAVPDPIRPEEVAVYGSSGPVAGAATAEAAEEDRLAGR